MPKLGLLLSILGIGSSAFAAGSFDVRTYGAKGDGFSNDTAAFNQAISAANGAGGGTVEVGAGTYVTGSIRLKSEVTLHLGAGATIQASDDEAAYDAPEENVWGDSLRYQDAGHSHWHNSLIWGEDLVDVAITGPGKIYGKGLNRGHASDRAEQRVGNKAIALRNCRNVTLDGFTIAHGGWFGILATGVDNLLVRGLLIDTNRDGMDIDCCRNVRITDCSVNSPWDDGICLKSSFGLGRFQSTEFVTINGCLVSGYDEGTLLDGTRRHSADSNPAPTGRIKFGTESNGGFKSIAITNCVFECSRGLALETVDGAALEDVVISNIAMRQIYGAPIFLRLGSRMRGPLETKVGVLRRVTISDIVAHDVEDKQGILIAGLADHPITDVTLHDILIDFSGGGVAADSQREIPEMATDYPEPGEFGPTTGWALFVRHAHNLSVHHVELRTLSADARTSIYAEDVIGCRFEHVDAAPSPGAKTFELKVVDAFSAQSCAGIADVIKNHVTVPERF